MKTKKIHSIGAIQAFYRYEGRKWMVIDQEKEHMFDNLEDMVKRYKELLEVPDILNNYKIRQNQRHTKRAKPDSW